MGALPSPQCPFTSIMTSFPKIYTVNGPSSTSSSTLPTWITTKPRSVRPAGSTHRKRVKTQREIGQLELIQDFAFPEAAIKIKSTEDGNFAIGTGTYKPMMKVWDLNDLTVKFERVTEAENVDFVVCPLFRHWIQLICPQILSSDWTKTLHLQRDRSISLHTQMGLHHSVRLPTYGRSLAYHSPSAEALVGCTGPEVFRLNLEEGRYMQPIRIQTDDIEGVNVVDVNPRHGLLSFGLDGSGVVEFWDPRSKSALTKLLLPSSTLLPIQPVYDGNGMVPPEQTLSVTALSSHLTDGLSLAVGTSTGHTLLYDLRSPTPFAVKDQGYGEAIRSAEWLRGAGGEDEGRVISADSKVIKVWSKKDVSTASLSQPISRPSSRVSLTHLAIKQPPLPPSPIDPHTPPSRPQFRSHFHCLRRTTTQYVLYSRPWPRPTMGWVLGQCHGGDGAGCEWRRWEGGVRGLQVRRSARARDVSAILDRHLGHTYLPAQISTPAWSRPTPCFALNSVSSSEKIQPVPRGHADPPQTRPHPSHRYPNPQTLHARLLPLPQAVHHRTAHCKPYIVCGTSGEVGGGQIGGQSRITNQSEEGPAKSQQGAGGAITKSRRAVRSFGAPESGKEGQRRIERARTRRWNRNQGGRSQRP